MSHAATTASTRDAAPPGRVLALGWAAATSSPMPGPYVNGEISHYLQDRGFLISLPGRWRELHARGEKLRREGIGAAVVAARLGISLGRWSEICDACRVRVVAMPLGEAEE